MSLSPPGACFAAPAFLATAFAVLASVPLFASVTQPANAGWIDVTQAPYNAIPNDGIDDTAAIQQAIDDATINMPDPNGYGTYLHYRRIVHIPDGTYTISAPLVIKDVQNNQSKGYGLTLQGQSRDGTVLRLTNNNAAFQSTTAPRAVFSTAPYYASTAWGTNIAFKINVFDLTVDTGAGNPGAIGLRYVVNNQGSMRDVHVSSSDPHRVGWAGIDMETWQIGGPALLKNVSVHGFDWGIRYGGTGHYSMVGEHITLNAQRVGGLRNQGQVFSLRGLVTTNQVGPSVSVLKPGGGYTQPSLVTLIDSSLSGSGASAITVATGAGRVFIRDTTTTGYTRALDDQGVLVPSVSNSEYASGSGLALWTPATASLRLPVVETPAPPASTENRALWVNVTNHDGGGPYFTPGSQTNPTWSTTNHSPRLQAAIDWAAANNRATVYFPFGEYAVGQTVRVHGSVRRIVGNYAVFRTTMDVRNVVDHPAFLFEDLTGPLFVEQINLYPGNQKKGIFFVNRSSHDVTIRNAYFGDGKAYRSDGATGRLFLEDVAGLSARYSGGVIAGHVPQFDFGKQRVWARQFDTEQDGLHVRVTGGDLWVLGLKTEEPGTVISASAGSRVEILGGLLLPSFTEGGSILLGSPAFALTDSAASIAITTHSPFLNGAQRPYYQNIVSETRGTETRTLLRTDAPARILNNSDKSIAMPLFTAGLLPDPDLVASWTFTHGPADEIGGHGGTLANGAQIITDSNGNKVLSLDGASAHLSVPGIPALLTTNAFTVMCWVKSNTASWNDYGLPLSYRNVFIMNSSVFNKGMGAWVRVDNSWKSVSVNMNNATLTQWNHLAITYGNQTARIFWNGQQIASGSVPGTFTPAGTSPFYFGRDQSNRFFNGQLDDVQVYNRALTATEIQAIITP